MKTLYKLVDENINRKTTEMFTINVFLTKKQYADLNEIKYKYRLSFTYIAEIIYKYYSVFQIILDKSKNEQFYKTKDRKTSIKIFKKPMDENNKAKVINNMLIIFLEKKDKEYLHENIYKKLRNNIYNQFHLTNDDWFDYNTRIRNYIACKNKFN